MSACACRCSFALPFVGQSADVRQNADGAASSYWRRLDGSGEYTHVSRWYHFLCQQDGMKELLDEHAASVAIGHRTRQQANDKNQGFGGDEA